jgi:hypothetical protein
MRKLLAVVMGLAVLAAVAGLSVAQVGKQGTTPEPQARKATTSTEVTLTDEKGQRIRPESLPPEAQAQLARVRKAAESLMDPAGTAQKVKVKIECSWPPLKCTITVSF